MPFTFSRLDDPKLQLSVIADTIESTPPGSRAEVGQITFHNCSDIKQHAGHLSSEQVFNALQHAHLGAGTARVTFFDHHLMAGLACQRAPREHEELHIVSLPSRAIHGDGVYRIWANAQQLVDHLWSRWPVRRTWYGQGMLSIESAPNGVKCANQWVYCDGPALGSTWVRPLGSRLYLPPSSFVEPDPDACRVVSSLDEFRKTLDDMSDSPVPSAVAFVKKSVRSHWRKWFKGLPGFAGAEGIRLAHAIEKAMRGDV
jgi:hypothetical protein